MAKVQFACVRALCVLWLTLLVGCDTEAERISELDSLRIIAVRADHPFAAPSNTVALEMLVNDASPKAVAKDGTKRNTRLLWLGSCVNPDGDLYYNCFPQLHESLKNVSDEELNAGEVTENTANARLGFSQNYQLHVPSNIIRSRAQSPFTTYPYGVVVMFYTACAGEWRVERDANKDDDYPIGCYDPDTNEALGQEDFEFGFYPIYAYETLENQLPIVKAVSFGVSASGNACVSDKDCETKATCGKSGRCIPRVTACQGDANCWDYDLTLTVDKRSAEVAVSAQVGEAMAPRETLWVSYYADFGRFEEDSRIIHDAGSGFTDDYHGVWTPKIENDSLTTPREAHLYAVVRDSRGGVTWVTQDVYVE